MWTKQQWIERCEELESQLENLQEELKQKDEEIEVFHGMREWLDETFKELRKKVIYTEATYLMSATIESIYWSGRLESYQHVCTMLKPGFMGSEEKEAKFLAKLDQPKLPDPVKNLIWLDADYLPPIELSKLHGCTWSWRIHKCYGYARSESSAVAMAVMKYLQERGFKKVNINGKKVNLSKLLITNEFENRITPQQRDAYIQIRTSSAHGYESLEVVALSPSGILHLEGKVGDMVYSVAIAPDGSPSHARVI